MKRVTVLAALAIGLTQSRAQETDEAFRYSPGITYTLLDGSYFVDDCLVCGRPTIQQTLRGTFNLTLLQNTPPFRKFAVSDIDFTASPGFWGKANIAGKGTYTLFEEFAVLQSMALTTEIRDAFTNHLAYFTNGLRVVEWPFPLIEIDLTQTNGTLFQTFSMHLVAAPVREVWFSVNQPFTATNKAGDSGHISPGDLLSNRGRVVKSNLELVGRLGIMPIVPDMGLDAVQVSRKGEIIFSANQTLWSETLGTPLQHGDLLSNHGYVFKRNQQLLAAFGVASSSPDAGLDAVQSMPDGSTLFSIPSDLTINAGLTLKHGDILSDGGVVFRTNQKLLQQFQPAVTNKDYGLDALAIQPNGEIWFSVTEGFSSARIGQILTGDVLSDRGYRIFSNRDLLSAFAPADPKVDYGLDAMFVISGLQRPALPPKFVKIWHDRIRHRICLSWDGDGSVFQIERATQPDGPWSICSPLLPELYFEDDCTATASDAFFYRLRQW